jgi:hypothetical protein
MYVNELGTVVTKTAKENGVGVAGIK